MYLKGYSGKNAPKALRLEQGSAIEAYAKKLQNNNCYHSPEAETIKRFLAIGLPENGTLIRRADSNGKQILDADKNPMVRTTKGWTDMSPQERYLYFTMGDANGEHNEGGKTIDAVCWDMIKQECFGNFGARTDAQLEYKYKMTMSYMRKDWVCIKDLKTDNGNPKQKRFWKPYNVRSSDDVFIMREWGM